MRLLTAGSLVRVQLGEPKKADTLMRIGFSFAILLTRTNDKLLQICLQIWQKQSGGLFRSRLHNLGARVDKRPFFYFCKLSEIGNQQQKGHRLTKIIGRCLFCIA